MRSDMGTPFLVFVQGSQSDRRLKREANLPSS